MLRLVLISTFWAIYTCFGIRGLRFIRNFEYRGKTLFINPRPLLFNIKDDNFFWPGKIKSLIYKIFISKITNFNFNEKIKNFEKINWAEYKKDIKFYNIMNFDKDNKTIKKVILNYL